MKKFLFFLTCIFSLFLASCASTGAAENPIEPSFENDLPANETDSTEQELPAQSEENTTEIDTTDDVEDVDSPAELFPELEDIEEPDIITLEPPEFIEEETESLMEDEPLEIDESDLIPEDLENFDDTVDTVKEDETSSDEDETSDEENDDDDDSLKADNDSLIDITNEDISASEINDEESSEIEQEEEIIPSRKVTLKLYEYLDITYPGNGWVYMGLTDNSKNLTYSGKSLGSKDSKFTLQARVAGTKIMHFYKEDALKNVYIDDYVEVEILSEKGNVKNHVTAPEYKQAVPKKAREIIKKNQEKKSAQEEVKEKTPEPAEKIEQIEVEEPVQLKKPEPQPKKNESKPAQSTVVKKQKTNVPEDIIETNPAASVSEQNNTIDTNTLLEEAKVLYNEKEYKAANEKISLFLDNATNKIDEGLYLKGQILEAKSGIQNIKAALQAYTTLTKNYPGSKFWDNANKRIIYLKRFYMEVR